MTKITDMFWQGRGFVAAETHQALAMQYDALQRQVGGQQQLGGQSCRSTAGVKTEGKENGADSKNRNRTNRRSEQGKGRRRRRSRSRGKGEGGSRASPPRGQMRSLDDVIPPPDDEAESEAHSAVCE